MPRGRFLIIRANGPTFRTFPHYRLRPATGLEDRRRLRQVPAPGDDKPAGTSERASPETVGPLSF